MFATLHIFLVLYFLVLVVRARNIWRVLTLPDECASMRAGGRGYNDTCNQPCTACDRHSVCDCAIRVNAFNCMHAVCGAPRANRCAHATAAKSYSVHCTLGSKRDEKSIDRLFFCLFVLLACSTDGYDRT
jgi:hypothetical protein